MIEVLVIYEYNIPSLSDKERLYLMLYNTTSFDSNKNNRVTYRPDNPKWIIKYQSFLRE